MTPEELQAFLEAAVKAAFAGFQGNPVSAGNGGGGRRQLGAKGVTRVETFTGKENMWREWAFQFRVATKAMNDDVANIMTRTEGDDTAHDLTALELEFDKLDVAEAAGELYDLL